MKTPSLQSCPLLQQLSAFMLLLLFCAQQPSQIESPPPPPLSMAGDTTISVYDTLVIDPGPLARSDLLLWYLDSAEMPPRPADSTRIVLSFVPADTGTHILGFTSRSLTAGDSDPCSIRVTVRLDRPFLSLEGPADTSVAIFDTLVLTAVAHDSNGTVTTFLWQIDSARIPQQTTTPTNAFVFGPADTGWRVLRSAAIDDDTLQSAWDSMRVEVRLSAPAGHLGEDTTLSVNDALLLCAVAQDSNGTVERYFWRVDEGTVDSGTSACRSFVFNATGLGRRHIILQVQDDDGIFSPPDTQIVTVEAVPPRLTAMHDTTVGIYDSVVLRAQADDEDGYLTSFIWKDSLAALTDTTSSGERVFFWTLADTGTHHVVVRACDDDTLLSPPDTIVVTVRARPPLIPAIPDTVLYRSDTLRLAISVSDSDGEVIRWFWEYAGVADSAEDGLPAFFRQDADTLSIRWGVWDDDTLVSTDTFSLYFVDDPFVARMKNFSASDTLLSSIFDSSRGSVCFHFGGQDLDGTPDRTITFRLTLQKGSEEPVTVYEGPDTSITLQEVDTAQYQWTLTAHNTQFSSPPVTGLLLVAQKTHICFTGHSIVTGYKGEPGRGGFRRTVLDTLCSRLGTWRVVPVGPLTTGYLLPASDDSCLAENGRTSGDIIDSLRAWPALNADIWVVMIGVNGMFYEFWERYFTLALIDSIYFRNRDARIYVLNGLPTEGYPQDAIDRLYAFNEMLAREIDERAAVGRSIYLVDAFSTLAPDSVFNPEFFAPDDKLHPNQTGYELLAREILRVMHE